MPDIHIEHNNDCKIKWAEQLIAQAAASKFYGKIEIVMQEGIPQQINKLESIKPPK